MLKCEGQGDEGLLSGSRTLLFGDFMVPGIIMHMYFIILQYNKNNSRVAILAIIPDVLDTLAMLAIVAMFGNPKMWNANCSDTLSLR